MAFSQYPVPIGEFANLLNIQKVTFDLQEYTNTFGLAAGDLGRSQIGFPTWTAEITLDIQQIAIARRTKAMLRRIGAFGTFDLYNPEVPFPAFDPDGSKIAGFSPRISQIGSDGRSMRLLGMPNNYQLRWGDFGSISYEGRKFLFEVCDDKTSQVGGIMPYFEINPPLREEIAVGMNVDFTRPCARMMLLDRSIGSLEGLFSSGTVLRAIEA